MRAICLGLLCAFPAALPLGAQSWLEPGTMMQGDDPQPWQVIFAYDVPEFAAELEARDALGLLELPTAAGGVRPNAFVGVFDTIDQAIATYRYLGFGHVADGLHASNAPAETVMNYLTNEGPPHDVHIFTLVRQSDAGPRDDRCLVRYLIDAIYNGFDDITVSPIECTDVLGAME